MGHDIGSPGRASLGGGAHVIVWLLAEACLGLQVGTLGATSITDWDGNDWLYVVLLANVVMVPVLVGVSVAFAWLVRSGATRLTGVTFLSGLIGSAVTVLPGLAAATFMEVSAGRLRASLWFVLVGVALVVLLRRASTDDDRVSVAGEW